MPSTVHAITMTVKPRIADRTSAAKKKVAVYMPTYIDSTKTIDHSTFVYGASVIEDEITDHMAKRRSNLIDVP